MSESDVSKLYDNLPDNSHRSRNEKQAMIEGKRVEKVVHGKVKTKKNNARKLTNVFITEDAANVKNYVLFDVIVPSIKKALYDLVVGALDMTLFGGRGGGSNDKRSISDKISYKDYNSISKRNERSYGNTITTSGYSYDDIVLETRGEAESVLSRMDEIIDEYDSVRVADLYDLVGITGDYTDNKYGWTNIRNARVVRTRDGYKIEMPRALPL